MMSGSFSVKLQSRTGQFIVNNLNNNMTIGDLTTRIASVIEVPESELLILFGYPPRAIDISRNNDSLSSLGITNGQTLIVEQKAQQRATNEWQPILENDEALARYLQAEEEATVVENPHGNYVQEIVSPDERPSGSSGNFNGVLLKKVVPADNSCLFTSVRFVMNGGKIDQNESSAEMRRIIAQEVAADPREYNDAVLGKTNADYCAWIQKPDSWGGAIEVSILSSYYGIEIDVIDIQNAIINRFGEDRNYELRVFLLFDGIHYDPLFMETDIEGSPATMFPVDEVDIYRQAEQLAKEARASRQYTNVNKFSVRCLQCDMLFVGQTAAQQHANSTGHTNFGEI